MKYRHKRTNMVVDAVQFDPQQQPWPDGVISWDTMPYRPRDGSWGIIETNIGREHVMNGDWIITLPSGKRDVCRPLDFPRWYEPVGALMAHEMNGAAPSVTVTVEHNGITYKGTLYPDYNQGCTSPKGAN